MTTQTPLIISLRRIKRWGACDSQYKQVKTLYPNGVPLTVEAALRLHEAGIDVLWGALRLLTTGERVEFMLFTLRQRQPHLVSLLKAAGHEVHAVAVEALRFDTTEDARAAVPVLDAARDASRAASRSASRSASWDASRGAARDASRSASRAASRSASRSASWDASRAASRSASWDASRDASRSASRSASWDASRAASWAASWAAAIRAQILWVHEHLAAQGDVLVEDAP